MAGLHEPPPYVTKYDSVAPARIVTGEAVPNVNVREGSAASSSARFCARATPFPVLEKKDAARAPNKDANPGSEAIAEVSAEKAAGGSDQMLAPVSKYVPGKDWVAMGTVVVPTEIETKSTM